MADYTAQIEITATDKASPEIKKIEGSVDDLSASLNKLAGFAASVFSAREVLAGIRSWVDAGVEFNQTMELQKLGLEATIMTFREYRDAQGKVVAGEDALRMASIDAAAIQDKLKSAAYDTTVTLEQLHSAYMRMSVGMSNQRSSNEENVRFMVSLSNYATVTGKDLSSLAQQASLAMNGIIRSQGQWGALMKAMHIPNEVARGWADAGTFITEMNKRLDAFVKLGPAIQHTWAGVLSNVRDVLQQTSGIAVGPVQEFVKNLGQGFVDAFTTTRMVGDREITSLSDTAREASRLIGETLRMAAETATIAIRSLWSSIADGRDAKDTFKNIALQVAEVKKELTPVLEQLGKVWSWIRTIAFTANPGWNIVTKGPAAWVFSKLTGATDIKGQAALQYEIDRRRIEGLDPYGAAPGGEFDAITTGSNPPPRDSKPDKKLEALLDKWNALKETLQEKIDVSALTGLDKVLGESALKTLALQKPLDDLLAKLAGKSGPGVDQARQEITNTWFDAMAAGFTRDQRAIDDSAKEYENFFVKLRKISKTGVDDRLEDERQGQVAKMEMLAQKQIEELSQSDAFYAEKKKRIEDATKAEVDAVNESYTAAQRRRFAGQTGDWDLYFDELKKKNIQAGMGYVEAWRAAFASVTTKMRANAVTMADGIAVGMREIFQSTQTVGQSTADFVVGVWNTIGSGFEEGVYDVITGKASSLGDVLRNIWDGILKDFSKLVTDMVKRWVLGQDEMGASNGKGMFGGLFGGGTGIGTTGAGLPAARNYNADGTVSTYVSPTAQAVQNGIQGYGVGSAIGSVSGAPGFSSGAAVGGVLGGIAAGAIWGTAAGPIGAVVGAIIGGLVAVLSSPNTEQHAFMVGKALGNAGMPALTNAAAKMTGGILDLAQASGADPEARAALSSGMAKVVKDYFKTMNFEIHAGSDEDMQKDIDKLFKEIVPSELMHKMFGQDAKLGGKNVAGISGASDFSHMVPTDAGPLTQFMESIGFTIKAIGQVADQIDVRTAADFQAYLMKLITVVISFNNNVKNLKKSGAELLADAAKSSEATALDGFHQSALALIEQAKELSQYTGDDQIERAQKLNDAVAARYQQELAFIAQISQAIKTEIAAFDSLSAQMKNAMPDPTGSRAVANAAQLRYEIFGQGPGPGGGAPGYVQQIRDAASDPAKVIQLAGQARDAISAYFGYLNNLLTQNVALLQGFKDLSSQFAGAPAALAAAHTTVAQFAAGPEEMQRQVNAAAKAGGQTQIDQMRLIQQTAAQRYQQEMAWLTQIQDSLTNFKNSIAGINERIRTDQMTPEEQANYYISQIQKAETRLRAAKTPEEIAQIEGEITGWANSYYGLFKDGDPKKAAAGAYLTTVLAHVQDVAEEVSTAMGNTIIAAGNNYARVMDSAATKTQTTIDSITTEIGLLQAEIVKLRDIVTIDLEGSVNSLIADNVALGAELKTDTALFTDVNTALTTLAGPNDAGSLNDLNRAAQQLATTFGKIASNADPGSSKEPGQSSPVTSGVPSSATLSLARNAPWTLASATGY